MKKILFYLIVLIVVLSLSRPATAALIDRGSFDYTFFDDRKEEEITGNVHLIYDTDFDITWVGDGNFAMTTNYDANGGLPWNLANDWVNGLTIAGFDIWRLPTSLNQDRSGPNPGHNITDSEMGHLFYGELGGTPDQPITDSGDPDLAKFPGLINGYYWSSTIEKVPNPDRYWSCLFSHGLQELRGQVNDHFSLIVCSGDPGGCVTNNVPNADAGDDKVNKNVYDLVTLDGSNSSDPDLDTLTYSWFFTSKPAGSIATISNPTSATPYFTIDVEGTYDIQLEVYDGCLYSNDEVSVTTFPAAHAVWVDFDYTGTEKGTFDEPFNSLTEEGEAIDTVESGGDIIIKESCTDETPTITKAMTIWAYDGAATIGECP